MEIKNIQLILKYSFTDEEFVDNIEEIVEEIYRNKLKDYCSLASVVYMDGYSHTLLLKGVKDMNKIIEILSKMNLAWEISQCV